jgi:hypothetical protein
MQRQVMGETPDIISSTFVSEIAYVAARTTVPRVCVCHHTEALGLVAVRTVSGVPVKRTRERLRATTSSLHTASNRSGGA